METFERIEKKYVLTLSQYERFLNKTRDYLGKDNFYKSRVLSIYYDTDDDYLIQRSLEKPLYKEKVRIRCYNGLDEKGNIFIELKKKFNGKVFKRRTTINYEELKRNGTQACHYENNQVGNEIKYVCDLHHLKPHMLISTYRTSYAGKFDEGLRITFDANVTYRTEDLDLEKEGKNKVLLPSDYRLMEIKVNDAMPIWLVRILDELKIYPKTFSKYGNAYLRELGGC